MGKDQYSKTYKEFCAKSKDERHNEYIKRIDENWEQVRHWQQEKAGWKHEHGSHLHDGLVYVLHVKKEHVYKLEGVLDSRPEYVFWEVVEFCGDIPTWNPAVKECHILETIRDDMHIIHNISAPAAGGMVSSRDFVNVTSWRKVGDTIFSVGGTAFHADAPESKHHVRAENNPSCVIFKEEHGGKCRFTMMTKMDLKGWLPNKVINQAITSSFIDYFHRLKARMELIQRHLKSQGKPNPDPHGSAHDVIRLLHADHGHSLTSVKSHKKKRGIFHFRRNKHKEDSLETVTHGGAPLAKDAKLTKPEAGQTSRQMTVVAPSYQGGISRDQGPVPQRAGQKSDMMETSSIQKSRQTQPRRVSSKRNTVESKENISNRRGLNSGAEQRRSESETQVTKKASQIARSKQSKVNLKSTAQVSKVSSLERLRASHSSATMEAQGSNKQPASSREVHLELKAKTPFWRKIRDGMKTVNKHKEQETKGGLASLMQRFAKKRKTKEAEQITEERVEGVSTEQSQPQDVMVTA